MNTPPEADHRRPGHSVNLLVSLATRPLPAQERARYDTEWRSELYYTERRMRLISALSLVRGSIPLALELKHRPSKGLSMTKRKDWRCRLGFHKYVRVEPPHMSAKLDYWFECARCGRFHDSMDGNTIASGFGGGWT